MHNLWVDWTPGLFLTEKNNISIHKQILGRKEVVISSTEHQKRSVLELHTFIRQSIHSIYCQSFTLKTEMKQQQFVSFSNFCNRDEGRICSTYPAINDLRILPNMIHQELCLPPLFLLTEIITLKYISLSLFFFSPGRMSLHFLKRIMLLLHLANNKKVP